MGQDCSPKGNLHWCTKEKGIPVFESRQQIYALVFSTKALPNLSVEIDMGNPSTKKTFEFPLHSLRKHPQVPSFLIFSDKYLYLLPFSPSPYPIQENSYRAFAQWLLEGKTAQAKELIALNYHSETLGISGCLHLSFKNGLGNFNFNWDKFQNLLEQIQISEKEIDSLLADSVELAGFHQHTTAQLKSAENILIASRNDHNKFQAEEKQILNELIALNDSVGFALNKAFISNNVEEARHVADITGTLEKRKRELKEEPVYKRIELAFQNDYRLSATRFSHARSLAQIEQKQAALVDALQQKRTKIAGLKAKIQEISTPKD